MKRFLSLILCAALLLSCCPIIPLQASAATSGTCGDNLTWTLDDAGTLTISGTGPMTDYSIGGTPWYRNCSSVKQVTIDIGVTTIGSCAFRNCSSLTSVTISNSVTSVGSDAFGYCSSLNNIYITDLAAWCNIDFAGRPMEYAQNLYLNGSLLRNAVIPSGVTSISAYAFYNCTNLTSVTIPDSVTAIGSSTFSGCSGLISAVIPDSVTSIGNYAFSYCSSLVDVTIGNGVTTIGKRAFYNCSELTNLTIGSSVTAIGEDAFSSCYNLSFVNLTSIAAWCEINFNHFSANPLYYAKKLYFNGELITSLVIPDGVSAIGDYAFIYCQNLEEINIPGSVQAIGKNAFYCSSNIMKLHITDMEQWLNINFADWYYNPLYSSSKRNKGLYLNGELITDLIIPETIQTIPGCAFYSSSITSVTIPVSVTGIGELAFQFCDSLTDVYYKGTQAQWDQISIDSNNTQLTNATLHTVEPTVTDITVKILPDKTVYWTGESLDTTGLVLTATYAGGSTKEITEGYTVSGFDSATAGIKKVTVTYEEKTATFDVTVKAYGIFDSNGKGYETLTAAIESVAQGSKLTITQDVTENVTVNKTVILDLNGFSINGTITVKDGCILYGMDSQTDDYTINDGKGYGKVTGAVSGVQAQDGYMLITEEDGISFHRVDLQLNTMTLRAAEAGIYFKSNFAGDELVAENVQQFGVALSVQGIPTADNLETDCKYSKFTGFKAGVQDEDTTSTLLKGVMKAENASLINYRNANMPIYGRAYILTNDGQYIFGTVASRTFKQQVEAIDTKWSDLSATQQTALVQMYEQFVRIMGSWNLPNLKEHIA